MMMMNREHDGDAGVKVLVDGVLDQTHGTQGRQTCY